MSSELNSGDLKIHIEGEGKIFGDLDLQVKAIKSLIESLDFKFAQEDDFEIDQKTYLVLLDAIGAMLKIDMPGFDNDETKNIEVVHQFLSWVLEQRIHKKPQYAELLHQDKDDLDHDW